MNPLTGDFDVVIEFPESLVDRIFAEMHARGVVEHRVVRVHEQQRVELVVNRPRVTLAPGGAADSVARAAATARVLFHVRPLADAAAAALTGCADVAVRATLALGAPDSATPGAVQLSYAWNETAAGDITVHGLAAAEVAQVRAAILAAVHALGRGRLGFAGIGEAFPGIAAVPALRFLASSSGRLAALGLEFGVGAPGQKAAMTADFLGGRDWALALSAEYLLGRIRDAMRTRWSDLPPPYGGGPVLVSRQNVCVLREPLFDKCLDHAVREVFLDYFDLHLDHSGIVFKGTARAVTHEWYVPTVSADFTFTTRIGIDGNGRLTIAADQSSIDFNEWYAEVFDFLAFGALEDTVRSAFETALVSQQAGEDLSALFSRRLLDGLASLGRSVQLGIVPRADAVETRPDGVIVRGAVSVPQTQLAPTSGFAVLRVATAPARRLFLVSDCWAPGGDLATLHWDFGDGQTIQRSGTGLRLAESHDFSPGRWPVTLRATNTAGRSFSYSALVAAGLFELVPDATVFARGQSPLVAGFLAREAGVPLAGVTLTASVPGWQEQRVTGADGRASFTLDPNRFAQLATPYDDGAGFWVTHSMHVDASAAGYRTESCTLLLGEPQLKLFGTFHGGSDAPFPARFGVFRPGGPGRDRSPVAGATVTVLGNAGWQEQKQSGADGYVEFLLDPAHFMPVTGHPEVADDFVALDYVIVRAAKAGWHGDERCFYRGITLPELGELDVLRERLEKWWEWPVRIRAELAHGAPLDPIDQLTLTELAVSLDALADFRALAERGARVLSVFEVVGVASGERRPQAVLAQRLDAVAKAMDTRLATAARQFGRIGSARVPVRLARPVARAARPQWSSAVAGVERAAAAAAALTAGETALPGETARAVGLLGKLVWLAENRSAALPVAAFLGLPADADAAAVGRRVEALLGAMRRRLVAISLGESLAGR